ncbi:MAG TPA: hypothetical protein VHK88_01190 [Aquihabitans sp.]|jgi:hypothetical protein|nr:hypothetical protein [Aquihabitans sp.]
MKKHRLVLAAALSVAMLVVAAPTAHADTITGQGTTAENRYRGGDPARGGVYVASSVQVNRNTAGHITAVRGAGRITKISKAAAVQVDRVALGTSTRGVAANGTPANSGTGTTVLSVTSWVPVYAGSCVDYRVRTNYSVRWTDGVRVTFSVLSPLTRVCGAPAPKPPPPPPPSKPAYPGDSKNCGDFATYAQAKTWFDYYYPHYGDVAKLDADNDRIPCESLP